MNDNIAAISSGLTESGIGVIRISGPDSYEIIDRIFRSKSGKQVDLKEPNRIHYGFIVQAEQHGSVSDDTNGLKNVSRETLDEVLVLNMKAPHTYTGEDTIEIDCHGGVLMMRRILENVLNAGARLAEPGEFTKRAFLNGRIDLSQAEAVMDVINAKNDQAAKASVMQLKGSVSKIITEYRAELLKDMAFIEAALDDPEHYSLDGYSVTVAEHSKKLTEEIKKLIKSYNDGRLIHDGIDTVILGKPNAGKSSLLNAILGEERAIVTQVPGTTRDTINESVSIGGLTLNIKDTAGIRKTDDIVESIGVEKAIEHAKKADLILYVIDSADESLNKSGQPDEEMSELLNSVDGKILILFNKSDLETDIDPEIILSGLREDRREYMYISALREDGIEELFRRIEDMFNRGEIGYNDQIVISSLRHVSCLKEAEKALNNVMETVNSGMPDDFLTIDLMDAYRALGEVIGEEVGEDLVNEIFASFCMGK